MTGEVIDRLTGLPVDDIPLPGDVPDLDWAGKLWGVDSMYEWDPDVSYVQNVLQGNPKLAALGSKIAPFVGPVAVAVGTAVAAYKTWEFLVERELINGRAKE